MKTQDNNIIKNADEMEVIKKMKEGNKEAFAVIFNKYKSYLMNRIVQKVRGNKDEAEDLTSEVLVKLYEKIGFYDNSAGVLFRTWMTTVADNYVFDHLRRKKSGVDLSTVSIDANVGVDNDDESKNGNFSDLIRDSDKTADEINDFIGDKLMVKRAIAKLVPKYQKLIRMRFFLGLSYEEIAEHFEEPMGTVKVNLMRAKDELALLIDAAKFHKLKECRKNGIKKKQYQKLDIDSKREVKSNSKVLNLDLV